MGVGISARAGFDPYGATRFLTAMEHECQPEAAAQNDLIHARRTSYPHIRPRPNVSRMRRPPRGNSRRPGQDERDHAELPRQRRRPGLWRGSERGLRARPALPAPAARLHLRRSRRFTSRTPRRPCSASRRAAARRSGSTSCAFRRSNEPRPIPDIRAGWMASTRRASKTSRSTASRRDRDCEGRRMVLPDLCDALWQ